MTLDDRSNSPSIPGRLMGSVVLSSLLLATSTIGYSAGAQVATQPPARLPPWADTVGESGVYPVGDAVDVYRAVFDLFFVDGNDRPSVIVMHNNAEHHGNGGPCPVACKDKWLHKSKIDTATIVAFARGSPKRPRIIPFGYPIPIVLVSWADDARMYDEARARFAASNRSRTEQQEVASVFAEKHPGAWGRLLLTKVGFNPPHSQALVQAKFMCGASCGSDEVLFLKRIDNYWQVIERIPNTVDGSLPSNGMRYRGPSGSNPAESEIVASTAGMSDANARSEGIEAAGVYRTVLDSLYSFHGESPRRIVVTDGWPAYLYELPLHAQPIQPSTLERYKFLRGVRAPLYTNLQLRAPVSFFQRDSLPALEQLGHTVEKQVSGYGEAIDPTPFWLGFRERYPGAWGMVGFTRVAFNQDRTQALLLTHHACGSYCFNADTWLLERSGGKWRIVERIPREKDPHWGLDSLRYLGVDANPHDYRLRRVHGVFVNAPTGRPLPRLTVSVKRESVSYRLITDSSGRYAIDSLPLFGAVILRVPCPAPTAREPLLVAMFPSHAGLDSTMNVGVDFRRCLLHRKARALVAGAKASPNAGSSYPGPDEAAVYRGVLDSLYPASAKSKGPILIDALTDRFWKYDVEAELPRLIRQAVVDASIERGIEMLPHDSAWLRPKFEYKRQVLILGPAEQNFLLEQGEDFREANQARDVSLIALAKEAYPGANAILSFSRVAFNDARTQALVQVSSVESRPHDAGGTLLLKKSAGGWRVVRRHVEREGTSGEMVNNRCEPTDAPAGRPSLTQLKRFVGDAYITSIGTSLQFRGHPDTLHLRFATTDTLHRFYWLPWFSGDKRKPVRLKNQQMLATVQIIDDSTGKARTGIAGRLEQAGNNAAITFTEYKEGYITFDGWFEQYRIMKVNGREFFGSWLTQSGPTVPIKGYFCGRLR